MNKKNKNNKCKKQKPQTNYKCRLEPAIYQKQCFVLGISDI
jgi:hypothetical protein